MQTEKSDETWILGEISPILEESENGTIIYVNTDQSDGRRLHGYIKPATGGNEQKFYLVRQSFLAFNFCPPDRPRSSFVRKIAYLFYKPPICRLELHVHGVRITHQARIFGQIFSVFFNQISAKIAKYG